MGDSVERALEETVPVLRAAQRAKLLSEQEITEVVRKRRDHEYSLARRDVTRDDFLKYAAFERELALLLGKRAEKRRLKKKKAQLVVGTTAARVNLVYSRAVRKFKADEDLWLHYARHCVRTGANRAAGKVFAKAIGLRGDSERVWLAAIGFHFDTCADARVARILAQRALRALPDSATMWKEYFRMEVMYLIKLISRRRKIGLSASGGKDPPEGLSEKVVSGEELSDEDSGVPKASGDESDTDPAEGESPSKGDADTTETQAILEPEAVDSEDVGRVKLTDGKLSFWDGGIPMAVFNAACKAVKFRVDDRAQFWDIVLQGPYVPPKLLQAVATALLQKFPECPLSDLINICIPWVVARTTYLRQAPLKAVESTVGGEDNDEESDASALLRQAVIEKAQQTLPLLENSLRRIVSESGFGDSVQVVLSTFVNRLETAFEGFGAPNVAAGIKRLKAIVLSETYRTEGLVKEIESGSNSVSLDPTTWSLGKFETLLKSSIQEGSPVDEQVRAALQKNVLVPFRDLDQERVLCLWISSESDVSTLRATCNTLISIPPVTMKSLRCSIDQELELWEEKLPEDGHAEKTDEELVSQVRKLFSKATALPGAKRDVELWLQYIDFERRVARDAKQASTVNWRALKALDGRDGEIFTERQTLRNLAR